MLEFKQSCENRSCKESFAHVPRVGDEFQCRELLSTGRNGWIDDQQVTALLKLVTRKQENWSIVHSANVYDGCIECTKRFIKARFAVGAHVVIVPISTLSHWVAIVVTKERVLFYNSTSSKAPEPAKSLLKTLGPEYTTLKWSDGFPHQDDQYNCGIYLIKAIESLATDRRWRPERNSSRECRRKFVEMLANFYKCMMGTLPVQDRDLDRMFLNQNGYRIDDIKEPIGAARLLFGSVGVKKSARAKHLVGSLQSVGAPNRIGAAMAFGAEKPAANGTMYQIKVGEPDEASDPVGVPKSARVAEVVTAKDVKVQKPDQASGRVGVPKFVGVVDSVGASDSAEASDSIGVPELVRVAEVVTSVDVKEEEPDQASGRVGVPEFVGVADSIGASDSAEASGSIGVPESARVAEVVTAKDVKVQKPDQASGRVGVPKFVEVVDSVGASDSAEASDSIGVPELARMADVVTSVDVKEEEPDQASGRVGVPEFVGVADSIGASDSAEASDSIGVPELARMADVVTSVDVKVQKPDQASGRVGVPEFGGLAAVEDVRLEEPAAEASDSIGAAELITATLIKPLEEKWLEIATIGPEMKLDGKDGNARRLNPHLAYSMSGLDEAKSYRCKLIMQPDRVGDVRREEDGLATDSCTTEAVTGKQLMLMGISFEKLAIWNKRITDKPHILELQEFVTYQPILQIFEVQDHSEELVSTTVIKETRFTMTCTPNAESMELRRKWRDAVVPSKRQIGKVQEPNTKRRRDNKEVAETTKDTVESDVQCDKEWCDRCAAIFQPQIDEMKEKLKKYKLDLDRKDKANLWLTAAYAEVHDKLAQLEKDRNA